AAIVALLLNLLFVFGIVALRDGIGARDQLRSVLGLSGPIGFNFAFIIATAALYARYGWVAATAGLLAIGADAYMARLGSLAQDRTRAYASLSWGVLSGLIRTLDVRDSRAARHCAATALFARDIAEAVGLSTRDCELAHTAGLLHDIGRFALPDRVMEREG